MTTRRRLHLAGMAAALCALLGATLAPYGGNPSALLHLDSNLAATFTQPAGTVILTVPGYDGMLYYRMALGMPGLFLPENYGDVASMPPGAYAYQRILLPALAAMLSLGYAPVLPIAFLAINLFALLLCGWLLLRDARIPTLLAWAVVLSPPALVGLHFSLAEPLTLLFITGFLLRYTKEHRLDVAGALLLGAAVLTREVVILFVGAVALDLLIRNRFRDLVLLLIPIGAFLALHAWIYAVFDTLPFFASTDKRDLPLHAVVELITGVQGYDRYVLSSLALFVIFVLPALVSVTASIVRSRTFPPLPTWALGAFLLLMLAMPDHIWGTITSIGRVITPVYPLFVLHAAANNSMANRAIALGIIALGISAGIGLALNVHPFTLST